MKMAILGAGGIARKMAETWNAMAEVESYAIAARDLARAEEFAKEFGFVKAYGSYEEMVQDPEVELVYIAVPHSHHYETTKLCLQHGKHVLCEKAFMVNAKQAKEVVTLAREKNCLLAEAIWTRYLPSRKMIDEVIASGAIGKVTSLTANLCYQISNVERMQKPELAGGALLDLGVYPINFASMVFGNDIKKVTSSAVISELGVDYQNSITLEYQDGKVAMLHSNFLACSDRRGMIFGDKGYLEIENINNCELITRYTPDYKVAEIIDIPEQLTGFEYQVTACMKAIQAGKVECEEMPHAESIFVMELMDQLRKEWGVVYPGE
ncbi:MAG: Gfo/Idh/MocA family oxidoreductase [Eubacteriales bacterium]